MTQRKRLSNTQSKRRSDPLGEDDSDLAFTQPSTSQGQKGLERFSSSQMEQMTAEVIQYFLMKDQKKIPVRRADLVKHVLKDYRHIYPDIMKGVQQTFDQVFGLKLVEIDTKNHLYILINKLEPQEGVTPLQGPANPKTGLLFVILSVIFMKRGAVKEKKDMNSLAM